MQPFSFVQVTRAGEALAQAAPGTQAAFIAGGTSLIDLMKLGVEHPPRLVDINKLPLDQIETLPGGGLRIGAMARNSDLAWHPAVEKNYPALSQALLSGASAQLRNLATVGGNLLQRTRCYYFRDTSYPCNKRQPGGGCPAIPGFNRIHAVLGTSDQCIATHPSDMCVAMAAFDAVIVTQGPGGPRRIGLNDFYIPYGQDPAKEHQLQPGELITAVELPALPFAARSVYVKVRDRASYEFALSSVAAAVDVADGKIKDARVALGGVATKPWRSREAEQVLVNAPAEPRTFAAAADAAMQGARPQRYNAFKIELAKRTIVRGLTLSAGLT